ncbi:DNA replication/repair protein RecF [Thermonema rossianum]|uniref:DNA replication/repair protein RecF n=1 Tax=Thermonema rossianum TaxID=55505 RepID=UPI0005705215|nr:DNA replication and repair protein RecF [Thermonema rossianum]
MTHLKNISLTDFKSYASLKLSFHEKLNILVGQNGVGKTNLLEAIYWLLTGKSLQGHSERHAIRYGSEGWSVEGEIAEEERLHHVRCAFYPKQDRKAVFIDGSRVERLLDYYGRFPVVSFTPNDIDLIREAAEQRRRTMDAFFAQLSQEYAVHLVQYHALLRRRNALLKQWREQHAPDVALLEVFHMRMEQEAYPLYDLRRRFTGELNPLVSFYYEKLSGGKEFIKIEYRSQLSEASLQQLWQESLPTDLKMGFTSKGIHRDDWLLLLNDVPMKWSSSQGQRKTFLVALKLAMSDLLFRRKQQNPLLLLDDIFDKLDAERVSALLQLVRQQRLGQVFITDTEPERMQRLLAESHLPGALFEVKQGRAVQL